MHNENHINLAKHRLNVAEEKILASKLLFEGGFFKDAIGRSYYAIFSATRAVLALDGKDFSKHAGVISCFQKDYVKKGIFDKQFSKILMEAFQIRNKSDYDDFYVASISDAKQQLQNAENFYNEINNYINKKIGYL